MTNNIGEPHQEQMEACRAEFAKVWKTFSENEHYPNATEKEMAELFFWRLFVKLKGLNLPIANDSTH